MVNPQKREMKRRQKAEERQAMAALEAQEAEEIGRKAYREHMQKPAERKGLDLIHQLSPRNQ